MNGDDHFDSQTSVTLTLPAGTYFVTLAGTAYNVSGNKLDVDCFVSSSTGAPNFGGTLDSDYSSGGRAGGAVAGSGVVSDNSSFHGVGHLREPHG